MTIGIAVRSGIILAAADLANIQAALQELVVNCQDGNTQCPMLPDLLAADRSEL